MNTWIHRKLSLALSLFLSLSLSPFIYLSIYLSHTDGPETNKDYVPGPHLVLSSVNRPTNHKHTWLILDLTIYKILQKVSHAYTLSRSHLWGLFADRNPLNSKHLAQRLHRRLTHCNKCSVSSPLKQQVIVRTTFSFSFSSFLPLNYQIRIKKYSCVIYSRKLFTNIWL